MSSRETRGTGIMDERSPSSGRIVESIVDKISERIKMVEEELGDPLIYVESEEQFNRILGDYELVVAVFSTSWCNPCQAYIPVVKVVARKYRREPNLVFVYVDTDALPSIADRYNVENLPTTIMFLNAHVADLIVGVTTLSRLEEKVEALLKGLRGG